MPTFGVVYRALAGTNRSNTGAQCLRSQVAPTLSLYKTLGWRPACSFAAPSWYSRSPCLWPDARINPRRLLVPRRLRSSWPGPARHRNSRRPRFARAARGAFDFRRLLQHFLQMRDDPVCFLQRASRRREIVQDEAAFVHLRQQIRTEKLVARKRDQNERETSDRECKRTLQRSEQPALIELDDAAEEAFH